MAAEIWCSLENYHVRCNIDFTKIETIYPNYNFYFYDSPDFDGRVIFPENVTTSMWRTFRGCTNFNSPVTIPNGVVSCSELFLACRKFNQPLVLPNTVITLGGDMLSGCFSFNQDIVLPDSVQYVGPFLQGQGEGVLDWKFSGNIHFGNGIVNNSHLQVFGNGSSGYLAPWKDYYNGHVSFGSGVKDISFHRFFLGCKNFNTEFIIPPNAIDCSNMFMGCNNFNQPVTIPSKVNNCFSMFLSCPNFNQPVEMYSQTNLNCRSMFYNCPNFNQPVTIPVGATDCSHMLQSCHNFNQSVRIPDGVTNCDYMFYDIPNFNCDLYIPDSVGSNYADIVHSSGSNFKATISTPYGGNCGLWPHPYDVGATIIDRNSGTVSVIEQEIYNNGRTREFWNSSGGSSYAGNRSYDSPTTIPEGSTTTASYFQFCTNYNQPTTIPSTVTDCTRTFAQCSSFDSVVTFED